MRSNLKAFLAVLALCALVTTFSLRETPKGTLALPAPKHQVVLVGFGGPEQPDLVPIADFIESHTGQRPRIGPDVDFSLAQMDYCLDRDRHQWDADKMVELIDVPEGAVAIAVFNDSLYTSGIPQWRYCFGLKRGHRAILSPANMAGTNPLFTASRLNKMTLRYVLEMAYEMPRKNDRKSLLHDSIMGPSDLDLMEIRI